MDGTQALLTPRDIDGLDDAIGLAVGMHGACARVRGGGLACWGSNDHGQLGVAPVTRVSTPNPIDLAE